ncbi:unnamed protein product, partial [Vitis vinifera]
MHLIITFKIKIIEFFYVLSQYIYSTGTHKQTTPFQNPGIHDSHKPKHSTAFSESRFFSLVNGAALCNLLLCSYASLSGGLNHSPLQWLLHHLLVCLLCIAHALLGCQIALKSSWTIIQVCTLNNLFILN